MEREKKNELLKQIEIAKKMLNKQLIMWIFVNVVMNFQNNVLKHTTV